MDRNLADKWKLEVPAAENRCPLRVVIKLEYHFSLFGQGKSNQSSAFTQNANIHLYLVAGGLGGWAQGMAEKFNYDSPISIRSQCECSALFRQINAFM